MIAEEVVRFKKESTKINFITSMARRDTDQKVIDCIKVTCLKSPVIFGSRRFALEALRNCSKKIESEELN